jgi:alkylation response protein AidB-like acyl-CoA dehydrogenase
MNHETALSNANEIANTVLAPAARQNDKDSHFSSEAIGAFGQSGLLALMLPAAVGGSGLGPRTFAAVTALLAEADASVAMVCLRLWTPVPRTRATESGTNGHRTERPHSALESDGR